MTEEPTEITEAETPLNEDPKVSETSEAPPVSTLIEEPPPPSPAKKQVRSKKQVESLGNARSTLAKKRQQQSAMARSDELAHLESVNILLAQNIELRRQMKTIPETHKSKSAPASIPPKAPPVEIEPDSPLMIQKPRDSRASNERMSARDLMRSMGM